MMLECINNDDGILNITVEQKYELKGEDDEHYYIVNDLGEELDYLKYCFKKEGELVVDYQEKLLELAKKEGIQGLKGEKYEDVYNKVFLKLISKNEKLYKAIEFKEKCFYELNDSCIEFKKENKKLLEMISKYEKEIDESNIILAELHEKEIKLSNENQKLRELVKLLL